MTDQKTTEETSNETAAASEAATQEMSKPATLKSAGEYATIVPGMTVRVFQKIKDVTKKGEEKERVQAYEGLVISRKHGRETGATIMVRKVTEGVAVEKIYPLNSPTIERIEILKTAQVRRAKLYFMRTNQKKLKEKVKAKA